MIHGHWARYTKLGYMHSHTKYTQITKQHKAAKYHSIWYLAALATSIFNIKILKGLLCSIVLNDCSMSTRASTAGGGAERRNEEAEDVVFLFFCLKFV